MAGGSGDTSGGRLTPDHAMNVTTVTTGVTIGNIGYMTEIATVS
jgi:hypothetical protein